MAKKAGAHHGGAWKVAYADFVTAMMALFMVLWISAQDDRILLATAKYFQNPFLSPMDATSGVLPFNSNRTSSSDGRNAGEQPELDRSKHIKMTFLNSVAADFYRLLHLDENFESKPIDIQVTSDGLRITLYDRTNRPLFVDNTTEFTEWGTFVMQNMAWSIDRHQFHVSIEGHTRANLTLDKPDYTGWELSADRANAARRLLQHYAVSADLIERVNAYSDTKPLEGEAPDAESNQRVTLNLTLSGRARFKESKLVDQAVPVETVKPTS